MGGVSLAVRRMGTSLLQERFWRCFLAYVLLAVVTPTFVTVCMDIERPEYAQFTFALGRGVLLYTFSGSSGLSFALNYVCHGLATVINTLIAVHCYLQNRLTTREQRQHRSSQDVSPISDVANKRE